MVVPHRQPDRPHRGEMAAAPAYALEWRRIAEQVACRSRRGFSCSGAELVTAASRMPGREPPVLIGTPAGAPPATNFCGASRAGQHNATRTTAAAIPPPHIASFCDLCRIQAAPHGTPAAYGPSPGRFPRPRRRSAMLSTPDGFEITLPSQIIQHQTFGVSFSPTSLAPGSAGERTVPTGQTLARQPHPRNLRLPSSESTTASLYTGGRLKNGAQAAPDRYARGASNPPVKSSSSANS